MSKVVLTSALLLGGKVDVKAVTAKDLADFIEAEKLDVKAEGQKKDVLNAICDALEARGDEPPEEDDADAVTGDPGVQQSNYLKRRAKKIAAGRGELDKIGSNLEEESKKSSYIARRFKKMNPKR
jgi:hypothetical protein